MKKLILNFKWLLFLICSLLFSAAQAQVVNYPVHPYYVSLDYINTNAVITHQGNIIAPKYSNTSVDISGTSNVVFKSGTQIELNPGFTAEPDENGSFVAEIDPQIDYILISPDPSTAIIDDMVHINQWEKLEIGFKLLEEYKNAVDNFFANYHEENNGLTPSVNPMLNPYADDSLNVEVNLLSPSGRQITKWGFFMRTADFKMDGDSLNDPGNTEKLVLDSNPDDPLYPYNWRFRFAPDEEGTWAFNVTISEPKGMEGFPTYTFNGFSFICDPPLAKNHGFLKVNQNNKRYLQFDDETPFFGIGEDLAVIKHWLSNNTFWSNNGDIFYKRDFDVYMQTLDEIHSAGANYIRKFLTHSDFTPEYDNLGVYDIYSSREGCIWEDKTFTPYTGNRQYNLWAFDKFIDKAHEYGIYIQLCVEPFQPIIDYQWGWGDNAYAYYTYFPDNFDEHETDIIKYFTDDNDEHGLRYYWKRRYKYIMSRWGYSVNLAAIESFNEIDQTLGFSNFDPPVNPGLCSGNNHHWDEIPELKGLIDDWHTKIFGYLKDTLMKNANVHLTTVSFTNYGTWKPHDGINTTADQIEYYQLFTNPNIDFVDIHYYIQNIDMFKNSAEVSNNFVHNTLNINRPFHFGEFSTFGNIKVNTDSDPEEEDVGTAEYFNNYDISFHNELWASTFMNTFTTGLTWLYPTVHWWPDANPKELYYGPLSTDYIDINNVLDEEQLDDLPTPTGAINFTNKKIFHNFKPLSDFIQQSEINFNDFLYPYKVYDDYRNVECYYLMNNNQTKAYGWLHNLNMYWNNHYYYYYIDNPPPGPDANDLNLQNYDCQAPLTISGFNLNGFESYELYMVNFYRTRMDDSSPLPPVSYILSDYAGRIDFDNSILNYLDCDSVNADFGFVIAKISNLKTSDDTNSINYSLEMNNDSINKNIINSFTNHITENDIEFLVYPNPSDGKFKIESQNFPYNYDIIISNELGKIIYNIKDEKQNTFIDISNQPKGIHILNITGENYNNYFKIVLK